MSSRRTVTVIALLLSTAGCNAPPPPPEPTRSTRSHIDQPSASGNILPSLGSAAGAPVSASSLPGTVQAQAQTQTEPADTSATQRAANDPAQTQGSSGGVDNGSRGESSPPDMGPEPDEGDQDQMEF
jgi:hypothetical protein